MQGHEPGKPIEISAIELVTAYTTDAESAESRFKGRILRVNGIVDTSGRNSC